MKDFSVKREVVGCCTTMGVERYHLGGKNSDKKYFPNANTTPPEDTEMAWRMGKTAERILSWWSGEIVIDDRAKQKLADQFNRLSKSFKPMFSKTMDYKEYFLAMRLVRQQTFEMGFLDLIDKALGTELTQHYEGLSSNDGMTHGKTHVLSTALALGREVTQPTFEFYNSQYSTDCQNTIQIPGTFVPKARLGILGEYDGVVIPENNVDLNSFNLQEWLRSGNNNYQPLELKLQLRPRFNTGLTKVKKIFSWDIKQIRHRLGNCILNWEENACFPLPRTVIVVYYRGLLLPISHYARINGEFWSQWYDDVERAAKGKPEDAEEQRLLLELIDIADQDPVVGNFTKFTALGLINEGGLKQKMFSVNSGSQIEYAEITPERKKAKKKTGDSPTKKRSKSPPQNEILF